MIITTIILISHAKLLNSYHHEIIILINPSDTLTDIHIIK